MIAQLAEDDLRNGDGPDTGSALRPLDLPLTVAQLRLTSALRPRPLSRSMSCQVSSASSPNRNLVKAPNSTSIGYRGLDRVRDREHLGDGEGLPLAEPSSPALGTRHRLRRMTPSSNAVFMIARRTRYAFALLAWPTCSSASCFRHDGRDPP